MIHVDRFKVNMEGDFTMLMSEISNAVGTLTAHIEEKTEGEMTQNMLLDQIIEAIRFKNLCATGMAQDEAFKVVTGLDPIEPFDKLEKAIDEFTKTIDDKNEKKT